MNSPLAGQLFYCLIVYAMWLIISHVLVNPALAAAGGDTKKFAVLMKNARPTKPESYLCTSILLDPTREYFVVGFTPNATMNVVHHMFLIGCGRPGSSENIWDCGTMGATSMGLQRAQSCAESNQMIYAWARNAPPLNLPEGVAFKLGKDTRSKYVVLQIHYADVSHFLADESKTDTSGAIIEYTETLQPKSAGVLLLGTGGMIPPMSTVHMETACSFDENKIIHPFAFRTHTHSLGRVVSGYRIRRTFSVNNNLDEWTLIGKKDPMLPQMFYPVMTMDNVDLVVRKGDILAARCTMVSNRTTITRIGATHADEMCNFYVMYWMDKGGLDGQGMDKGDQSLNRPVCFTGGPPTYFWKTDEKLRLTNIPERDASTL